VVAIRTDGVKVRITHLGDVREAMASPTGRRIAFVRERSPSPEEDEIHVLDVRTGGDSTLVAKPDPMSPDSPWFGVRQLQFTPDERWLYWISLAADRRPSVYRIDLRNRSRRFVSIGSSFRIVAGDPEHGTHLLVDRPAYSFVEAETVRLDLAGERIPKRVRYVKLVPYEDGELALDLPDGWKVSSFRSLAGQGILGLWARDTEMGGLTIEIGPLAGFQAICGATVHSSRELLIAHARRSTERSDHLRGGEMRSESLAWGSWDRPGQSVDMALYLSDAQQVVAVRLIRPRDRKYSIDEETLLLRVLRSVRRPVDVPGE
jgi:hypothetical protein